MGNAAREDGYKENMEHWTSAVFFILLRCIPHLTMSQLAQMKILLVPVLVAIYTLNTSCDTSKRVDKHEPKAVNHTQAFSMLATLIARHRSAIFSNESRIQTPVTMKSAVFMGPCRYVEWSE